MLCRTTVYFTAVECLLLRSACCTTNVLVLGTYVWWMILIWAVSELANACCFMFYVHVSCPSRRLIEWLCGHDFWLSSSKLTPIWIWYPNLNRIQKFTPYNWLGNGHFEGTIPPSIIFQGTNLERAWVISHPNFFHPAREGHMPHQANHKPQACTISIGSSSVGVVSS